MLGAAFQIGRSALTAYQSAIALTGQNIANAGNADYARVSGRLTALAGGQTLSGISPGTGVDLSGLERHVDEAVEARLRLAYGSRAGAETRYRELSRIEALYNELTEEDLSTQLSTLFTSLSDLQTDPLDDAARRLVLSNAEALTQTLHRHRSGLQDQVKDLNQSIRSLTNQANAYTREIAELNELIVAAEGRGRGGGAALRDRRDALLRQLAELVDIQTRPQDNGVINVYLGSETLVEYGHARELVVQSELQGGLERLRVRFADNQAQAITRAGRLAASIQARDRDVAQQMDQLDQLAAGLIFEMNRAHSSGHGLVGYTSITGSYTVRDPTVVLNSPSAGLRFTPVNGAFKVHVRDTASGQTITRQIEVDLDGLNLNDTTANSLAAALAAVPDLSASVTADGRLQIIARPGFEVSFTEDSSGVLAAMGIGTFFDGHDAATIALNPRLKSDPRLLATSLDGAPGDGSNAGRMSAVGELVSALLDGQSVLDFHKNRVGALAVEVGAATATYESADAVYSSLYAQRESISGVSLDEEVIRMTTYERAFQGAARYVNVLESMADEIIALLS